MMRWIMLILMALLCGCNRHNSCPPVAMELPEKWPTEAASAITKQDAEWWGSFQDPMLSVFIAEALDANSDVLIATTRVAQYRALAASKDSAAFPDLSLQAAATRARTSKDLAIPGQTSTKNQFSLSAVLNFELDLWGQIAQAKQSAQAQLLSTVYNRQAIKLIVSSDVALAYFNLCALELQITCMQRAMAVQQKRRDIAYDQWNAGTISEVEYNSIEIGLDAIASQLPFLYQQKTEQTAALGALLGRSPKDLCQNPIVICAEYWHMSQNILHSDSLPSRLLENRPDIAAAEQQLRSAHADVGVAKAAYFPQISLSGLLGFATNKMDHLFTSNAKNWNVGGNVTLPLINFGRNKAAVAFAEAKKQEAMENYRRTVRVAFQESIAALEGKDNAKKYCEHKQKQTKLQRKNVLLNELRYQAGSVSHDEVLKEKALFLNAKMEQIKAKKELMAAHVALYKALGGKTS